MRAPGLERKWRQAQDRESARESRREPRQSPFWDQRNRAVFPIRSASKWALHKTCVEWPRNQRRENFVQIDVQSGVRPGARAVCAEEKLVAGGMGEGERAPLS